MYLIDVITVKVTLDLRKDCDSRLYLTEENNTEQN